MSSEPVVFALDESDEATKKKVDYVTHRALTYISKQFSSEERELYVQLVYAVLCLLIPKFIFQTMEDLKIEELESNFENAISLQEQIFNFFKSTREGIRKGVH